MANYLVVEWSKTGNVLLNPPQLEALASRSVIARDGLQWETQCSCSIKQNFGKAKFYLSMVSFSCHLCVGKCIA